MEATVQAACMEYALLRGALVVRVNQGAQIVDDGGKRRYFRAAYWQAPGMDRTSDAGIADLLLVWRGVPIFVECKYGGGKLRQSQDVFLAAADEAGAVVVVAYSVDDLVLAMQDVEKAKEKHYANPSITV